jgi:hypothetical protein
MAVRKCLRQFSERSVEGGGRLKGKARRRRRVEGVGLTTSGVSE